MSLFRKLFGKKAVASTSTAAAEISTTQADQFAHEAQPLDSRQSEMIAGWLNQAPLFLKEFGDSEEANEMLNYDKAFHRWLESNEEKPDRNEVISVLGAYLGNRLVSDYGMQWMHIRDQFGEEFGVKHQTLEVVAYPFDTVIKRIESRESGFISVVYKAIGAGISGQCIASRVIED